MLELLINKSKDKNTIMLLKNGILIENHEEHEHKKRLEGNIYVGRVENVIQGMRLSLYKHWRKAQYLYKNKRFDGTRR